MTITAEDIIKALPALIDKRPSLAEGKIMLRSKNATHWLQESPGEGGWVLWSEPGPDTAEVPPQTAEEIASALVEAFYLKAPPGAGCDRRETMMETIRYFLSTRQDGDRYELQLTGGDFVKVQKGYERMSGFDMKRPLPEWQGLKVGKIDADQTAIVETATGKTVRKV